MNYCYLFVDNLNGHPYVDGFHELTKSISVLKQTQGKENPVYVFNNEIEGKIFDFCQQQNLTHIYHPLTRNYSGSDKINPISILVEKINVLNRFDENQDIVFLDTDTAFTQKVDEQYWDENHVVLHNIEYFLCDWRNLGSILPRLDWKQIGVEFDRTFPMYNTGVIYIPKRFRKELTEKALWIVDQLNNGEFPPEERMGNKLDEQIALSIVLHDTFGRYGHIKLCHDSIYHYWAEKQNGIKWWENPIDQNIKQIKIHDKDFQVVGKFEGSDWKQYWDSVNAGTWEPETFQILRRFLDRDHSFLDIGAWIGPVTLYGSQLAKHCYSVEPDPAAFKQLSKNVQLNQFDNVTLCNDAIHTYNGETRMGNRQHTQGNSMSGILWSNESGWDVNCSTFVNFFQKHIIRDCNFIKMDIEGTEVELIQSNINFLKSFDHTLYVALHPIYYSNYYSFRGVLETMQQIYGNLYLENGQPLDINFVVDNYRNSLFSVLASKVPLSQLW